MVNYPTVLSDHQCVCEREREIVFERVCERERDKRKRSFSKNSIEERKQIETSTKKIASERVFNKLIDNTIEPSRSRG